MKYSDRHISDEELDQLFRDAHASEGQEALFVPEFWSDMEAMLPAEKKKKRSLYWIPLAATAVLVGILLFYPSSPAKIDRFDAQNEQEENSSLLHTHTHTQTHTLPNQQDEQLSALNTQSHASQNLVVEKPKGKTTVTQKEQRRTQEVDKRVVEKTPPLSLTEKRDNPEDKSVIVNQETNSNPLPIAVETNSVSYSELDSVNLQARYEEVPLDEIAPLPQKKANESNEWYVEAGPTLGQSPYLSPDQKRNVVGGVVFGGGYTKRIDNAFVSLGLQARMEGFGGLEYRETNFSSNIVRTVSVKQLYSLEVPLKFGYALKKRSEFVVSVTPGLQLFLHGKERITENQVVQREKTFTGKVEHSNSLTMEFGLQYYYNITSRFSLGAKLNADILRPFHTDYYLGKSAGLPVNGQIVFRTRFSK